MNVYQLKIDDLDMFLDPVFKTEESAMMASKKYYNRKVSVVQKTLDSLCDCVYRVAEVSEDGISLRDSVFATAEGAKNYSLENNIGNSKIYKEDIINGSHDYELIEV